MSAELDPAALRAAVERAMHCDPDAWEALYRHCHPRLLNYARRRLATSQAAEDAVSEALIRAIQRIDGFSWKGAGFDGWMYGILRNVVFETQRNEGQTQRIARRQAAEFGNGEPLGQADPTVPLESAEEAAAVRRAFESLTPSDQELLELRVVGGLSAAQTATVLGKKPGAVRMAQSRALERLRKAMGEASNA